MPTVRAMLIHAEPVDDGAAWLASLRDDEAAREAEVDAGLHELNAVLRAHRAAAADPYAREVTRWQANVVRVGYGSGEQVAEGRFTEAYDVPEPRRRVRRAETLGPQERLAAVLSGSDAVLVAEELVLRARLDLDAGRTREAALQARIALEALRGGAAGGDRGRRGAPRSRRPCRQRRARRARSRRRWPRRWPRRSRRCGARSQRAEPFTTVSPQRRRGRRN